MNFVFDRYLEYSIKKRRKRNPHFSEWCSLCGNFSEEWYSLCGDFSEEWCSLCGDFSEEWYSLCGDFSKEWYSLSGDLKTFMRDSYNKAELFLMIANCISQIRDVPTFIIATINEKEISNGFDIDLYIDSFDIIQSTRSRPKINCFWRV